MGTSGKKLELRDDKQPTREQVVYKQQTTTNNQQEGPQRLSKVIWQAMRG